MRNTTGLEGECEIRLLFMASNPTFRPVVTRFLEQCDELSVVGTLSGNEQVVAQAQDLRPQVILLDMDTSDRSGLQTIANLRTSLPGAGIVALSLLCAGSYRQVVLAAGADDLVLKSNLRIDLLPAIRRAAQGGRYGQAPMF